MAPRRVSIEHILCPTGFSEFSARPVLIARATTTREEDAEMSA